MSPKVTAHILSVNVMHEIGIPIRPLGNWTMPGSGIATAEASPRPLTMPTSTCSRTMCRIFYGFG